MADIKEGYKKRSERIMDTVKLISEKFKELSGSRGLTEEEEITNKLREAFEEWKKKEIYFESVTEPDLIDHAIYEIEASKTKYIYFLKKAKKKDIKAKSYL